MRGWAPQVGYTLAYLYEYPSALPGRGDPVTGQLLVRMVPFAVLFSVCEAVGFMMGTTANIGWSVGNGCMALFLLGVCAWWFGWLSGWTVGRMDGRAESGRRCIFGVLTVMCVC